MTRKKPTPIRITPLSFIPANLASYSVMSSAARGKDVTRMTKHKERNTFVNAKDGIDNTISTYYQQTLAPR